eukprot:Em0003g1167a
MPSAHCFLCAENRSIRHPVSSNHSILLLGQSSYEEIANLSEDEDGKEDVTKATEDEDGKEDVTKATEDEDGKEDVTKATEDEPVLPIILRL